MKIVPVLDVLNGQVVHGVGGRRADYRPIKSCLTASSDPVEVAEALHRHYGFTTFYVADLDAIAGAEPAFSLFAALRAAGFQLWVDAGIVEIGRAVALGEASVTRIIAGLETLAGPDVLAEICREIGEETIFSLDLRAGEPVRANTNWKGATWEILEQAIDVGVKAVLLLDLARVGMQMGTGTEELSARLAATWPTVEIIAGGGIRNAEDMQRLERSGVGTVLMATGLHNGAIQPESLTTEAQRTQRNARSWL